MTCGSELRIYIPAEMRARVEAEAQARGLSASAFARSAVRGLLSRIGSRDDHVEALQAEVEHLRHILTELTTPPPEHAQLAAERSLTAAEAAILGRLLRTAGKIVSYDALSVAVVAAGCNRRDYPSRSTIKVQTWRLRRKLAGSGIGIDVVYGEGLRAIVAHRDEADGASLPPSPPVAASSPLR